MVAWKDMMAAKVNELASARYEATGDGGGSAGEQLRAGVALFERALDRRERFCVSMARLDIDDRLAKIFEAQAHGLQRPFEILVIAHADYGKKWDRSVKVVFDD